MTPRRLVLAAIAALAVAVAAIVVVSTGGSDPYVVKLHLADADGLRSGSPVVIAGLTAGSVSLHIDKQRNVVAELKLDRSHAPVGQDATASISSLNLLGQKRVEVSLGDRSHPVPSGTFLPASRITTSTDLDQVLDVLDPSTRVRLGILINEAGAAFTGRRGDFSQVLQQMPRTFVEANQLLGQLVADNHTLGHLVTTSDGFVAELASQRHALSHMVDVVGQTGTTLAERRTKLRATLSRAPGTLATLRSFLAKLQATTVPLGPAARTITATSPSLSATLAQVDPFRRAADPTLAAATKVAPELTTLASGATPVVQRALPVVNQLAGFSQALAPVSDTLDHSIDNLLAVMQNWSRAIQFRDGLSHVFRGEATITPDMLTTFVDRLLGAGAAKTVAKAAPRTKPSAPAATAPTQPSVPPVSALTQKVKNSVTGLLDYLVKP
jgi:virulence factor Mce-like protein